MMAQRHINTPSLFHFLGAVAGAGAAATMRGAAGAAAAAAMSPAALWRCFAAAAFAARADGSVSFSKTQKQENSLVSTATPLMSVRQTPSLWTWPKLRVEVGG